MIGECHEDRRCSLTAIGNETKQSDGDEHNGLCKDDRHHVSSKHLEGDVLTNTTYLLTCNHSLSILYGHLANALNKHDSCQNDSKEEH